MLENFLKRSFAAIVLILTTALAAQDVQLNVNRDPLDKDDAKRYGISIDGESYTGSFEEIASLLQRVAELAPEAKIKISFSLEELDPAKLKAISELIAKLPKGEATGTGKKAESPVQRPVALETAESADETESAPAQAPEKAAERRFYEEHAEVTAIVNANNAKLRALSDRTQVVLLLREQESLLKNFLGKWKDEPKNAKMKRRIRSVENLLKHTRRNLEHYRK